MTEQTPAQADRTLAGTLINQTMTYLHESPAPDEAFAKVVLDASVAAREAGREYPPPGHGYPSMEMEI